MRYCVAKHFFDVVTEPKMETRLRSLMDNYAPFAVESSNGTPVFSLEVVDDGKGVLFTEETRQQDEGQEISCGVTAEGLPVFEFFLGNKKAGILVCSQDFSCAKLHVSDLHESSTENHLQKYGLNNALMVLYALATSCDDTVLFHSAVVMRNHKGYMFLGKSGTGKSTHARMWLRRFDDAELLNDDNPVVRLESDGAWVYGSPWSGKTSCYKNCRAKLAGIIDLSQAPQNRIFPIVGVEAYMALVVSISGMRWNRKIADGLHATENRLAGEVKMFHLECLPNEEAAEVCYGAF